MFKAYFLFLPSSFFSDELGRDLTAPAFHNLCAGPSDIVDKIDGFF